MKVPLLKTVHIIIMCTSSKRRLPEVWSAELKSIQDKFVVARIKFQVSFDKLESTKSLILILFFKESDEGRVPGLGQSITVPPLSQ